MTNYRHIAILFPSEKPSRDKFIMANEKNEKRKAKQKRPSALKRDLQSQRRNLRNRTFKAKVNTAVRSFHESVSKKDSSTIKVKLNDVYSMMDKGVKKGIFKMNKARRVKSRLHALSAKA